MKRNLPPLYLCILFTLLLAMVMPVHAFASAASDAAEIMIAAYPDWQYAVYRSYAKDQPYVEVQLLRLRDHMIERLALTATLGKCEFSTPEWTEEPLAPIPVSDEALSWLHEMPLNQLFLHDDVFSREIKDCYAAQLLPTGTDAETVQLAVFERSLAAVIKNADRTQFIATALWNGQQYDSIFCTLPASVDEAMTIDSYHSGTAQLICYHDGWEFAFDLTADGTYRFIGMLYDVDFFTVAEDGMLSMSYYNEDEEEDATSILGATDFPLDLNGFDLTRMENSSVLAPYLSESEY